MKHTARHFMFIAFMLSPPVCLVAATEDPHGSYDEDCSICHEAKAWKPAQITNRFDHSKQGFALEGAHTTLQCRSCHESLDFKLVATACADCHEDVHRGELGPDCVRCHTTRNFIERANDLRQHRLTRFPLVSAHATADCSDCHSRGSAGQMKFVNTPMECQACHIQEFEFAKKPDHVASGFPRDCEQCHTTSAWVAASLGLVGSFNHSLTGFPLQGAHGGLNCDACHTNNQYQGTPADCYSCHQNDFTQTANPDHQAAGFSTNCASCHSTTTWLGAATFDHSVTAFPLQGAHRTVTCESCHTNNQYQGTPTDCYSCHLNDYTQAANPNHLAAGFPTDCASCHGTTAWLGATFDHSLTAFPLQGAHISATCESCHTNNQYQGTPTDCYSCHLNDYAQAANPNHLAAGFPTDCASCHGTTTWFGATFDHDTFFFPIYSGKHQGKWNNCADCHLNAANYGQFSCTSCHKHADQTKVDDDHQGIPGYVYTSEACYTCHPQGRT